MFCGNPLFLAHASATPILQVTSWFDAANDSLKVKAAPKPAFLETFFAGK